MKRFKILLLGSALLLNACGSLNFFEPLASHPKDLNNTHWVLQSIEPHNGEVKNIPVEEKLTLDIDKDGFSGSDGCNTFHGEFTQPNKNQSRALGVIKSTFGGTEMACPQDFVGDDYTKALLEARSYTLEGDQLVIVYGDNSRLVFEKASKDTE